MIIDFDFLFRFLYYKLQELFSIDLQSALNPFGTPQIFFYEKKVNLHQLDAIQMVGDNNVSIVINM